ncbi:hypothetical protein IGI04_042797 [Brassica rapa subsp. trilocularis]|uniref:Uncharacterized protein n=1 Tax=Brassica rapa subsp. trilocularis TaxID=1813537 RepID=A0ABQ7KK85_BRACM|nr:hypothetical protein IGI04_042797 [Brassica rapa subsp. trilocularis]
MNFLTTDINFRGTNLCLSVSLTNHNKVLNGKGCQLTYRDFETVQHSDENFGYGEPEATTHYEHLITSKVTLRGVVSTFPVAGNPELHNIQDAVERPHRREKLVSATELSQARSLRSDRAIVPLGRYVATELEPKLGRYVATELEPKLGRYVVTERSSRSRPSDRPARSLRSDRARAKARSLRSDRAIVPLGRYVATERSSHSRPSDRPARSLRSDRAQAEARSLRSDRALVSLGRYIATGLEPKFGRCVAIEPFRTSIRHQSLHSRQTFECYLPKTVASSVYVSRYSNSSIKLRGLETAEKLVVNVSSRKTAQRDLKHDSRPILRFFLTKSP